MYRTFVRLLCLGFLACFSFPALALDDTPQNRQQEADRYLQATPPKLMFADMTNKIAATLPAAQRDEFVKMMTQYVDFERVTNASRDAMVKTFTADELHALADFYASSVGKSAMAKMGDYMAILMPIITQEIQGAMLKVQAARQPK